MLDKKDFATMEGYLKDEDSQREILIVQSRTVLKDSKAAIYSIHRKDLSHAASLLEGAEKTISRLKLLTKKYPHLSSTLDNALQEYVEAKTFYGFVHDGKLPTSQSLDVDPVNYLAGLSDLTGELARLAVIQATAKDRKAVEDIRNLIDEVFGHFLKFDLRNSELRKKSDSIKWNLQKVEDLLYDLSLKVK